MQRPTRPIRLFSDKIKITTVGNRSCISFEVKEEDYPKSPLQQLEDFEKKNPGKEIKYWIVNVVKREYIPAANYMPTTLTYEVEIWIEHRPKTKKEA